MIPDWVITALENPTLLALTMWEPWGSAIVHGTKRVENRPWRRRVPPEGLVFAMHTAKRRVDVSSVESIAEHWPGAIDHEYELGVIIGLVRVRGIVRPDNPLVCDDPWTQPTALGHVPHWCWMVDAVHALSETVPVRGFQMLWRVPDIDANRVRSQFSVGHHPKLPPIKGYSQMDLEGF